MDKRYEVVCYPCEGSGWDLDNRRCETCEGRGRYELCHGCEEAPLDEAYGPELCEGCAKSCPICEHGTTQSGEVCQWCVEADMAANDAHERAHAWGRV